ncbi:MAG: HlyD family type I secretion periplasmic adaptor subunit [Halofilum sp. (in: g-proteobacteria)]|nr:HlyD family type I secretion periplasmic adaptor subunit [Halofilum sp. (in: g-proteobacteria)]
MVDAVLVADGDRVISGQPVVRMRAVGVLADVRHHQDELDRSRVAAARLEGLLRADSHAATRPPVLHAPGDIPLSLVERERQLMRSEWAAYRDREAELQREHANGMARLATIEASIASIDAVLPYLEGRVERMQRLVAREVASRQDLDDARRELVDKQQERRVEQHRLAEGRAQLGLVEQRLRGVRSRFRTERTASLAELEARAEASRQELTKARSKLERRTLRAPIDGIVQDVAVHTAGAVVRPADVLMRIVPEDQPLEVEAQILNRDIGFAYEGQEVEVKFQAYDFTRYGSVPGVIRDISPASTDDEQLGRIYSARVQLARHHVLVDGEQRPLRPGLTATVDIDMGQRRIIEYFLAPILRYRDKALSER